VHEAGEADGVLFIAMRFVMGGDLRRVLDREGALRPDRAAGFISPVASALDAAHAAGLVHRDVKPANILVDASPGRPDHVYLSDFGVSKGAVSSVSLTGTGQFLGTPDYAAPEQIRGQAVDGRADQYALACVAYQLLTGAVLFERDQGLAVLLAHLSEPPPSLSSRRPGLPAAADRVLARGLAKAPGRGTGPSGPSRTRCGRRSAWRPTIPAAPPPRPGTRNPRSSHRRPSPPDQPRPHRPRMTSPRSPRPHPHRHPQRPARPTPARPLLRATVASARCLHRVTILLAWPPAARDQAGRHREHPAPAAPSGGDW
jgi:serine/threonine protein kinase